MANTIQFTVLGDVKDLEDKLSGLQSGFNSTALVAGLAFAGLTASAIGFVEAAAKEELAVNELNQALKNRGNYTAEVSKDLVDYATALSTVSLFSKTAIIEAETLFASFGFEGQALKDLTKAAADFAQGRGMDIVSASGLIAKSVSSSVNALVRYGIEITGAAGSTQRAASAVQGIEKAFGGQALAATQGYGAIALLKNEMQTLSEEIGTALEPSVLSLTQALKGFIDFSTKNPAVAKMAADFLILGLQITGTVLAIALAGKAWISFQGTLTLLRSSLILIGPLLFTLADALTIVAGIGLAAFVGWKLGELIGQVTGLNNALSGTQGILTKIYEGNQIQKIQDQTAAMLKAHNLEMSQVKEFAAAKLAAIKTTEAAQLAADQQTITSQKNVDAFFASSKKELTEIANTQNQKELTDLEDKFEKERQGLINNLKMEENILQNNGLLTEEKQKEIDDAIAAINAKYDGLEYEAAKVQQTKLTTLQQEGLDTYKKVQDDQLGTLTSTLQTAAGLNKEFAIAYRVLAIGQAIVNTDLGITAALSKGDFISAAIIAATGAVQIAGIAAQSFEVGTGNVPYDMTAQIHKSEIIVPPNFSDAIRSGQLALTGGGAAEDGSSGGQNGGTYFDFKGALINGVSLELVKQIFKMASEGIHGKIITPLPK